MNVLGMSFDDDDDDDDDGMLAKLGDGDLYPESGAAEKAAAAATGALNPFDIDFNVGADANKLSRRGDAAYAGADELGLKWRQARVRELMGAPDLYGDVLNALFTPDPEERLKWEQAPETAFGAIFSLTVLAEINVVPIYVDAWRTVAAEHKLKVPATVDIELALQHDLRLDHTIVNVFEWTQDPAKARDLSRRFEEVLGAIDISALDGEDEVSWMPMSRDEKTAVSLRDGADWWLETLASQDVPCAVVTRLPRRLVVACLDRLNLSQFFGDRIVCQESKRVDADQAFLHAALALGRQPMRCAVFSDAINDLIQAHEAGMRSVGVLGRFRGYDLQAADLTISRLDDLRLSNIRRLFSDVDFEPEPELEVLQEQKPTKSRWDSPTSGTGPKNRWTELSRRPSDDEDDSPDTETDGPGGGGSGSGAAGGSYRANRYGRRRR